MQPLSSAVAWPLGSAWSQSSGRCRGGTAGAGLGGAGAGLEGASTHSSVSSLLWWGLCCVLQGWAVETTSEHGISTSPSFEIPAEQEKPCQAPSPAWGDTGIKPLFPPPARAADRDNRRELLPEPALSCQTLGQGSPSPSGRRRESVGQPC